jgi:hypothetical protein
LFAHFLKKSIYRANSFVGFGVFLNRAIIAGRLWRLCGASTDVFFAVARRSFPSDKAPPARYPLTDKKKR